MLYIFTQNTQNGFIWTCTIKLEWTEQFLNIWTCYYGNPSDVILFTREIYKTLNYLCVTNRYFLLKIKNEFSIKNEKWIFYLKMTDNIWCNFISEKTILQWLTKYLCQMFFYICINFWCLIQPMCAPKSIFIYKALVFFLWQIMQKILSKNSKNIFFYCTLLITCVLRFHVTCRTCSIVFFWVSKYISWYLFFKYLFTKKIQSRQRRTSVVEVRNATCMTGNKWWVHVNWEMRN